MDVILNLISANCNNDNDKQRVISASDVKQHNLNSSGEGPFVKIFFGDRFYESFYRDIFMTLFTGLAVFQVHYIVC